MQELLGPTLAYWLLEYGIRPTNVERAPELRTGATSSNFWGGAGFELADRMGSSEEIKNRGYKVQEVRIVNRRGKRVAGFLAATFTRYTRTLYQPSTRRLGLGNFQENRRQGRNDL